MIDIHRCPRRDLLGLRVRLLRNVRTKGGDLFRARRIMQISDRWGGLFALRTLRRPRPIPTSYGERCPSEVSKVDARDFRIVGGYGSLRWPKALPPPAGGRR